jgi:7-carboxy-7-deazaguanine synthase (Cx14CxxC type)
MPYHVKEIYYTLQGEGAQAGRPAVFCRFTGCNLWSGREEDRADAVCPFCDTDFVGVNGPGGGVFSSAKDLAVAVARTWPGSRSIGRPLVVCSGGEPLLQLDEACIAAFHRQGFEVAVETNGTKPAPPTIDWLCVSPKAGAPLVQTRGNELKLVFPQAGLDPADFLGLDFDFFFLQPLDGPNRAETTRQTLHYCLEHPIWRLSLQVQKILGIP